jgi:hypothetical protein
MTENCRPMKIWCLMRDQFAHVKPVEAYLGEQAEFIYDDRWDPDLMVASQPHLVLCVNDYPYDIARCLDVARAAQIPSLVLQDGILEWRCQYENPLFGAGGGAPQHQPVLADKIACIGLQSARQIAAWGNATKVEVTGMPRLDVLLNKPSPPPKRPGQRILIMTAKKPWFTEDQGEIVMRALADIKAYFEQDKSVQPIWRLTRNIEQTLGVENQLQELSTLDLAEVLSRVDAVITTPTTAILEAMLMDRPVAALDYHNVPRFVPTAWTISASEHLPMVVQELINPPAIKMAFQQNCLRDCLYCEGPAAPKVAALITKMADWAQQPGDSGSAIQLPFNLLGFEDWLPQGKLPSLREFYPDQAVFAENDIEALQSKLARLQKDYEEMKEAMQVRKFGYWLDRVGRFLAKKVRRETGQIS